MLRHSLIQHCHQLLRNMRVTLRQVLVARHRGMAEPPQELGDIQLGVVGGASLAQRRGTQWCNDKAAREPATPHAQEIATNGSRRRA
jgi:hypothetical protein